MSKFWKRLIFISVLICLGIAFCIFFSFITTEGYTTVTQKGIIDNKYFIYVDSGNGSVRLECSESVYKKVIMDEYLQYHISFKWSTLRPNVGKLLFIKLNETIDIRDKIKDVLPNVNE